MAGQGPERFGGEGLSMPLYGLTARRPPKKGRPLLALLLFVLALAAVWWIAREVFGVSFAALADDLLRSAAAALNAARGFLGL